MSAKKKLDVSTVDPVEAETEPQETMEAGIDPPTHDPAVNVNEIPVLTVERAFKAYAAILEADKHFKTCQSAAFREHVRSVLNAPNVKAAFEELKALIGD